MCLKPPPLRQLWRIPHLRPPFYTPKATKLLLQPLRRPQATPHALLSCRRHCVLAQRSLSVLVHSRCVQVRTDRAVSPILLWPQLMATTQWWPLPLSSKVLLLIRANWMDLMRASLRRRERFQPLQTLRYLRRHKRLQSQLRSSRPSKSPNQPWKLTQNPSIRHCQSLLSTQMVRAGMLSGRVPKAASIGVSQQPVRHSGRHQLPRLQSRPQWLRQHHRRQLITHYPLTTSPLRRKLLLLRSRLELLLLQPQLQLPPRRPMLVVSACVLRLSLLRRPRASRAPAARVNFRSRRRQLRKELRMWRERWRGLRRRLPPPKPLPSLLTVTQLRLLQRAASAVRITLLLVRRTRARLLALPQPCASQLQRNACKPLPLGVLLNLRVTSLQALLLRQRLAVRVLALVHLALALLVPPRLTTHLRLRTLVHCRHVDVFLHRRVAVFIHFHRLR